MPAMDTGFLLLQLSVIYPFDIQADAFLQSDAYTGSVQLGL